MGKSFCKIENKWCALCKRDNCVFTKEKVKLDSLTSCPKQDEKRTITFKELLAQVDFDTVMKEMIENIDSDSDPNTYRFVVDKLNTITPQKTNWFIQITRVHEEADPVYGTDAEDWIDVSGIDPRGQVYAIEFSDWDKWLGMNFTKDTLENFNKELIVAACLWEMTFNGYTEEEVSKFRNELMNSYENIKNKEFENENKTTEKTKKEG